MDRGLMSLAYGTHPRWYISNTDPAANPSNRVRDGKGWVKTTSDNIPWGGILGIFLRDNGAWQPFPFAMTGASSALAVLGLDGRDGDDGWPGPKGDKGDAGTAGTIGRDGLTIVGRDGDDGEQGWPGRDGRDGVDGRDGIVGSIGVPGRDGEDGDRWPLLPSTTIPSILDGGFVATNQSTTSTSYADLATVGPSCTVVVPASGKLLVNISACLYNATGNGNSGFISFVVSGANTIAAGTYLAQDSAELGGYVANVGFEVLLTGLTPGSTTIKMQYRCDGATWNFFNRCLTVQA